MALHSAPDRLTRAPPTARPGPCTTTTTKRTSRSRPPPRAAASTRWAPPGGWAGSWCVVITSRGGPARPPARDATTTPASLRGRRGPRSSARCPGVKGRVECAPSAPGKMTLCKVALIQRGPCRCAPSLCGLLYREPAPPCAQGPRRARLQARRHAAPGSSLWLATDGALGGRTAWPRTKGPSCGAQIGQRFSAPPAGPARPSVPRSSLMHSGPSYLPLKIRSSFHQRSVRTPAPDRIECSRTL